MHKNTIFTPLWSGGKHCNPLKLCPNFSRPLKFEAYSLQLRGKKLSSIWCKKDEKMRGIKWV